MTPAAVTAHYCRHVRRDGKVCGNRLAPAKDANFYWCLSTIDPITGHQGCSINWPASTVLAWANDTETTSKRQETS